MVLLSSSNQKKVLVVVNADGRSIAPTETFIRGHIRDIQAPVIAIVGNPGFRKIEGTEIEIMSRRFLPLFQRWLSRKFGTSTVDSQDTASLAKFIRENRISCVLAEYGMTAVSIMRACELAGVPLVAHFHGYDAYRYDILEKYKNDYVELFRKADRVIAVSQHMKNHLISLGAPAEKVIYNSCGADLLNISPIPFSERSRNTFIMVGRLTHKKGPLQSIKAFSKLAKEFPEARLTIIGNGPLETDCRECIRAYGLESSCIMMGKLDHNQALEEISKSYCFLQHSITSDMGDMEGTPVAVLEAMMLGIPVIATRHGGIVDIINNESLGRLVGENDVDSMTDAMTLLLRNPEVAKAIGEEARKYVLAEKTAKIQNEKLWRIIDKSMQN